MVPAARARGDIIGIFCGGFMKFKIFMIFNFFELGFFIDLRAPSVSRKTTGRRARGDGERRRELLRRVSGRQSMRGHHTNVL